MFCPQTFNGVIEKDKHVLEHFAQESCMECKQTKIRIDGNWYVLHNAVTCVKQDENNDTFEQPTVKIEVQPETNDDNTHEIYPEEFHRENEIKIEPIEDTEENDNDIISFSNDFNTEIIIPGETAQIESCVKKSGRVECGICGKSLSHKCSLRRHLTIVHSTRRSIICTACVRVFSSAEEQNKHTAECMWKKPNPDLNLKEVTFECYICKVSFKTKAKIRDHMRWKHDPNVKTFNCQICGLKFFTKWLLRGHLNRVHLNVRNFVCSICGHSCKTKDQLISHENCHTSETTFKCTFEGCNRQFRSRSAKTDHIRLHTGKKPYRCPIAGCDERFFNSIYLKRHKELNHAIFSNTFSCDVCHETFPKITLMKKHAKLHDINHAIDHNN